MKRRRIIKIAFFLIFIFLAQALSFVAFDSFGLLNHEESSKSKTNSNSIVTGIIHTDALVIHQVNRKAFLKVSIQKFQCSFAYKINSLSFSMQSFLNKGILIDMRSKIGCIMSSYFHSANYKDYTYQK